MDAQTPSLLFVPFLPLFLSFLSLRFPPPFICSHLFPQTRIRGPAEHLSSHSTAGPVGAPASKAHFVHFWLKLLLMRAALVQFTKIASSRNTERLDGENCKAETDFSNGFSSPEAPRSQHLWLVRGQAKITRESE